MKYLLLLVPVIVVLFSGCMKDDCYRCTTTLPLVAADTFYFADSVHEHCEIDKERKSEIETGGTHQDSYMVNDQEILLPTRTQCIYLGK